MAGADVLEIQVQSGDVQTATVRLRGLTGAAQGTERAVGGLRSTLVSVTKAYASFLVAQQGMQTIQNLIPTYAKFETGLVAVGKTTGMAGKELKGFGRELQKISLMLPISTTELLKVGTVAGQLGIKGGKALSDFTKIAAKMGIATELSGEEAAFGLNKIRIATGSSLKDVKRIADEIVILGNNIGVTEKPLIRFAGEVGRATQKYNISTGAVLSLSAAMLEMGVQAELGGSVIGKTFLRIESAIANGGQDLQNFADIVGMSGEAVEKAYGEDKVKLLVTFLKRLNFVSDGTAEGGNQLTRSLEALGLKGDEINKTLPPLIDNIAQLENALNLSAKGAGSLGEEVETAINTINNKYQMLINTLGVLVEVYVEDYRDAITDTIDDTNDFIKQNDAVSRSLNTVIGFVRILGNSLQLGVNIIETFLLGVAQIPTVVANMLARAGSYILNKLNYFKKGKDPLKDYADKNGAFFETMNARMKTAFEDFKSTSLDIADSAHQLGMGIGALASEGTKAADVIGGKLKDVADDASVSFGVLLSNVNKNTAAIYQLSTAEKKQYDRLVRSNKALKTEVAIIGLSDSAQRKRIISLKKAELASLDAKVAASKLGDELRREIQLLSEADTKTALSEFAEGFRGTFHDIFTSGKNAFESLANVIKTTLIDMLFELTAKRWIINLTADLASSLSSGALSAVGGAGGSAIMGALGIGGAAAAGTVTLGSGSLAGASGLVMAEGATLGLSGGAGAAGLGLSTLAGPAALGALGGAGIAKLTGGNPVGGGIGGAVGAAGGFAAGTQIGAIGGPLGALIGGALGGLIGGLFGGDDRDYQAEFDALHKQRIEARNKRLAEEAAHFKAIQDMADDATLELLKFTSPDGAALASLRIWREEATAEAVRLGQDVVMVDEAYAVQRLAIEQDITDRILAQAEETKKGLQQNVRDALSALSKAVSLEKRTINSAANDVKASMSIITGTLQDLNNALVSLRGVDTSPAAVANARGLLESALGFSQSGGLLSQVPGFESALQTISSQGPSGFSTAFEFEKSQAQSAILLEQLISETEGQLSLEELTLQEMEASVERLDALLESNTAQANILLGINDGILSVSASVLYLGEVMQTMADAQAAADARAALDAAAAIAQANQDAAAVDAARLEAAKVAEVENEARKVAERGPRLVAMWQALDVIDDAQGYNPSVGRDNQVLGVFEEFERQGLNTDDAIRSTAESFGLPSPRSFAVGTNVVPFDMNANIHKGERIIPAADNRQLMNTSNDTANQMAGMRSDLKAGLEAVALNTMKIRKLAERHDAEGTPPVRIPA